MLLKISSDVFKDIYKIDSDGTIKFKIFLAGEWVERDSWFDVKSPIDLSVISRVSIPTPEDINHTLKTLYEYGRWDIRNMPGYKRLNVLYKVADLLEENSDDFVNSLVINAGKTIQSAKAEVSATVDRLKHAELDLKNVTGDYIPGDWSYETIETEAIVRREPVGIVLAITPFNYPLFDTINKLSYSILVGNAFAVKPASADPIPVILLFKILEKAGLPSRALALLTVPGKEMERIVSDPRIAAISLTGSSETGIKVLKTAGIKQFIMELGGGDPAIILADADLKWAAQRTARGIYSYTGQRCDAIKIILVENPVYDEFKQLLIDELKNVKVGDPRNNVDVGPLIDTATADEMMSAIDDAVSKGGRILAGGRRLGPTYVEPTLIEAPRDKIESMILFNKEIFAPVALITNVKSYEEASELYDPLPAFKGGVSLLGLERYPSGGGLRA